MYLKCRHETKLPLKHLRIISKKLDLKIRNLNKTKHEVDKNLNELDHPCQNAPLISFSRYKCNGYRRKKLNRWPVFKSWTRVFAFHFTMKNLEKAWIFFSLHYSELVGQIRFFSIDKATSLVEGKLRIYFMTRSYVLTVYSNCVYENFQFFFIFCK